MMTSRQISKHTSSQLFLLSLVLLFAVVTLTRTDLTTSSGVTTVDTAKTALPSRLLANPIVEQQRHQVATCTPRQRTLIRNHLTSVGLSNATRCPLAPWLEDMYRNMTWMREHFNSKHQIAVSIGCNKAFDAVDGLRRMSHNTTYSKHMWTKKMGILDYGACWQGLMPSFDLSQLTEPLHIFPTTMHCVEPMPSTIFYLRDAAKRLQWESDLKIYHASVSDKDGTAAFFNDRPGTEHVGIDTCQARNEEKCENVTTYRLDTFVDKFVLDNDESNMIDILSIDTEGADGLILDNSVRTLTRVRYLEFEMHHFGAWGNMSLQTVTNRLEEKFGFVCYWAGEKELWRITECWVNGVYDQRDWSNVACVKPFDPVVGIVAERMERTFLETLATFEKNQQDQVVKVR